MEGDVVAVVVRAVHEVEREPVGVVGDRAANADQAAGEDGTDVLHQGVLLREQGSRGCVSVSLVRFSLAIGSATADGSTLAGNLQGCTPRSRARWAS